MAGSVNKGRASCRKEKAGTAVGSADGSAALTPPGIAGAVVWAGADAAGGFAAGAAPVSRAGSRTGCSAAKFENSTGNAGAVGAGTAAYGLTLTGEPGGTGAAGATDRGGSKASGNAVKNSLERPGDSNPTKAPGIGGAGGRGGSVIWEGGTSVPNDEGIAANPASVGVLC